MCLTIWPHTLNSTFLYKTCFLRSSQKSTVCIITSSDPSPSPQYNHYQQNFFIKIVARYWCMYSKIQKLIFSSAKWSSKYFLAYFALLQHIFHLLIETVSGSRMHDIMATIKCKSSNSPFSSTHSCRRHNDLSCTFKQRLALSFLWYTINYLSMILPSWLLDLSGSAEMPSWPKFALFGLPSGYLYRNSSPHNVSQICGVKRTRPKKPSIRRKISRDRFL